MIRLCFVCLGNICRSPIAKAVMREQVQNAALGNQVEVDAAGTSSEHLGSPPDWRARSAGVRHGFMVDGRARQFTKADWDRFDYILAMDSTNLRHLTRQAPSKHALGKLHLLRSFDASSLPGASVPDPYYGGDAGFDEVVSICERACSDLLQHLRKVHRL
ncbi:MAG TPA: low molecular weight protein-tyrosine-phosphatase [Polyangiaceae bacterium]